jgi:K+-sensing histidine kinase KdpD
VVLEENIRFARDLGAKIIKLKRRDVADALIDYARQEGITHVVFGQSARSGWDILLHRSVINAFCVKLETPQFRWSRCRVPEQRREPTVQPLRKTSNHLLRHQNRSLILRLTPR